MDGLPLLRFSRDAVAQGEWSALRTDHRSGRVTRIWAGAYVTSDEWARMAPDGRRLLRIAAARRDGDERIYSDESAAALWGMPLVGVTDDRVVVVAPSIEGGRTSGDLLKRATVVERATQSLDGLRITTPAQTVSDLARRLPFRAALAAADWTLAQGLATLDELIEANDRMRRCHGYTRAARAIRSADPRAESPLESVSRSVMIDLGVEAPVLQSEIVDARGTVRRPDFSWPGLRLLGECDGREKYERESMTGGRSPAQVVWEEKQREDALRALDLRMIRWGWREAMDPPLLARILVAGGLHPARSPRVSRLV